MIWNSGWRSRFVSENYWRGGWRGKFSDFLNRLGNALAVFNNESEMFDKVNALEDQVKRLHDDLLESTSISVQFGMRLEEEKAEVERLRKLLIVTRT